MWRGISLANKCLLLFGAAVLLVVFSALSIPWLRMNALVDEAQKELSRQLVEAWRQGLTTTTQPGPFVHPGARATLSDAEVWYVGPEEVSPPAQGRIDRFLVDAWRGFRENKSDNERHEASWEGTNREYKYARAARDADEGGALKGMFVLKRTSTGAARLMVINTAYLLSAGLIALGLAVLAFYLITTRLILSPVRSLKETAEIVREGNLATRSDIQTGDEFEELSETFNQMLENLTESQDQLRAINTSLDLKVNELSERNVALFEANKLKGEFLANVSHELRTPLNSIIGFTELLLEAVEKEAEAGDDSTRLSKRRRYLENIHNSGRSLLEMINGLLDMAKLDAGKMELKLGPVNLRDACEGWAALFRPLADRGGVELVVDSGSELQTIETDSEKLQQVVVNLMSNAIKFTSEKAADERASGTSKGDPARVTLRAERLVGRGSEGLAAEDRVRISVRDTGPGIAPEDQKRIFEKFQQLDSGHTRRHTGTGLGLAITKELCSMLQGELQLESEPGRGSMFSVILPMKLSPERAKEMRLEMAFRGQLAAQKERA
ncbi:MAG: HAMP domain-containing protein [Phycisphaerales bacterium]|nr:HAMP domain-containing protein [Phycisphaerales bacterium]